MSLRAPAHPPVTGVVLAGGRSRRMAGSDKGLIELAGRPLIDYVIAAFKPQVQSLMISANRNLEQYGRYGAPVVADTVAGFAGPLSGMLSALQAADTPLVATVPCDAPLLAADYVARLAAALGPDTRACVAHDGQRLQPVFTLLRRDLADSLQAFVHGHDWQVRRWLETVNAVAVDFSDSPDQFTNVNTPADVSRLALQFGAPHD